eukprot:GHVU01060210.1.p1 GENE.GHVU01060210.1~~GHVU01060210.1.p1  ORF type:complete len:128 (-),score=9.05 GHVU01060210.1:232-561(-)
MAAAGSSDNKVGIDCELACPIVRTCLMVYCSFRRPSLPLLPPLHPCSPPLRLLPSPPPSPLPFIFCLLLNICRYLVTYFGLVAGRSQVPQRCVPLVSSLPPTIAATTRE